MICKKEERIMSMEEKKAMGMEEMKEQTAGFAAEEGELSDDALDEVAGGMVTQQSSARQTQRQGRKSSQH